MNQLLIGDCHFGVKSNSIQWLDKQCSFFKNQIYNILDYNNIGRVVFLGDLTDIRYSINQQVGIELKALIRELVDKYKNIEFIFIAGNHDYYSPLEDFIEYNSYDLLFGEEFTMIHKNVKFINKYPELMKDGSLFLPWYWTDNTDHFDELLYQYDFKTDVKAVFCHADLSCWPGARIATLQGVPVYSGHIHYIYDDPIGNLHNIGAAFPLTFNDVNQERYVYILDDNFKITNQIANNTTWKFKRIYNEDIFSADDELFRNSFVQLCIYESNMNKAEYVDQIKYLKTTHIDANIRVHVIEDENNEKLDLPENILNTNIDGYIETNIPEHLTNKFEIIKNKLKEE